MPAVISDGAMDDVGRIASPRGGLKLAKAVSASVPTPSAATAFLSFGSRAPKPPNPADSAPAMRALLAPGGRSRAKQTTVVDHRNLRCEHRAQRQGPTVFAVSGVKRLHTSLENTQASVKRFTLSARRHALGSRVEPGERHE